jgi:hypothetical protein
MFFFTIFKPFMTAGFWGWGTGLARASETRPPSSKPASAFMCFFWEVIKVPYFFSVIRCVVSFSTRAFEYTSGK